LKQLIREQNRHLERSIMGIKDSQSELERQEKVSVGEIRKAAAAGQKDRCKILAAAVIRSRKTRTRLLNVQTQMETVQLQTMTVTSTQALTESMHRVTVIMATANRSMKLPVLNKIMVEFQKQSMQMDLKQEMVGDALGDVMDGPDDEKESGVLVDQMLDEIGIHLKQGLVDAPSGAIVVAKPTAAAPPVTILSAVDPPFDNDTDRALEARLNNLKRSD